MVPLLELSARILYQSNFSGVLVLRNLSGLELIDSSPNQSWLNFLKYCWEMIDNVCEAQQ